MYHLIALKTVLPTLKSAREYCSQPRPPQFILSSDRVEDCVEKADRIGPSALKNDVLACLNNGLPYFGNVDWTYFIVKQE